MKIAFVGCCYEKDIYSQNFALLTQIAGSGAIETRIVTSNCNCFLNSRKFKLDKSELLLKTCHAVTIPYVPLKPSRKHGFVKYMVVRYLRLNIPVEISRGLAFCVRCLRSDIIHFDQVLKAFGAVSFLTLLVAAKALRKKVIVTVHEIDPIQQDHPRLNRLYNLADQIVVFSNAFLRELTALGIDSSKVKVIPYCVRVNKPEGTQRRFQFIFFGGHHLDHSKGIETLLQAVKILEKDLSEGQILIYTGAKCDGVDECRTMANSFGIDGLIRWSEFLHGSAAAEAYQSAIACLIPYESGSGKYPACMAMANGTPVITTRDTDVSEYVGKHGIYVERGNPSALAESMLRLMRSDERCRSLSQELNHLAKENLSYEHIRGEYLRMYAEISGPVRA